jgi:excisionase family DNA binding protein
LGDPTRTSANFNLSPAALEAIARRLAELLNERPGDESWIDTDGAAEHMGCAKQRVYDLVSKGLLPHGKDGSRLVFQRSALDRYLRSEAA